jgi:hypothetical protein
VYRDKDLLDIQRFRDSVGFGLKFFDSCKYYSLIMGVALWDFIHSFGDARDTRMYKGILYVVFVEEKAMTCYNCSIYIMLMLKL